MELPCGNNLRLLDPIFANGHVWRVGQSERTICCMGVGKRLALPIVAMEDRVVGFHRWLAEDISMRGGRLSLSEFSNLPENQQQEKVTAFARAVCSPTNGELRSIADEIASYEIRYEMPSNVMQERLESGAIKETADICSWLMLLEVRDSLARPTT